MALRIGGSKSRPVRLIDRVWLLCQADARMWDEDRQMQLFQERFDDVDGSATCKVSYRFGEVTISTSPRFAAMYMNGQEIEDTMTRTGLRPELVWKRWEGMLRVSLSTLQKRGC